MKLDLYSHERGFQIVARNVWGETCEMISQPGDHIWEYVNRYGRLNNSYVVYWLTEAEKNNTITEEQQVFLDFLNKANDGRSKRKVRKEGWKNRAGLSTGEVPHMPKKPGDVVVHGDVARGIMRVIEG